jgi:hypothetical protein
MPLLVTAPQVRLLVSVLEGVLPKDRNRGGVVKSTAAAAEQESREEFFEGLGNMAEAPKYLRIKGKVGTRPQRW